MEQVDLEREIRQRIPLLLAKAPELDRIDYSALVGSIGDATYTDVRRTERPPVVLDTLDYENDSDVADQTVWDKSKGSSGTRTVSWSRTVRITASYKVSLKMSLKLDGGFGADETTEHSLTVDVSETKGTQ